MQLEKQVSSPEPSKRLRELNVKQESVFYWIGKTLCLYSILEVEMAKIGGVRDFYSAFTVAELGEMLPQSIKNEAWWFETLKHHNGRWMVCYAEKDNEDAVAFHADTEADARAKMLIYLLENKLISNE